MRDAKRAMGGAGREGGRREIVHDECECLERGTDEGTAVDSPDEAGRAKKRLEREWRRRKERVGEEVLDAEDGHRHGASVGAALELQRGTEARAQFDEHSQHSDRHTE